MISYIHVCPMELTVHVDNLSLLICTKNVQTSNYTILSNYC